MNRIQYDTTHLLFALLFMVGAFLTGCAEMGQIAGQVARESLNVAVTEGTDRAMGKHKGKVSSIRVLREDQNGYLIEVRYRGVRMPQGVSISADAYGPPGLLTEYVSSPVPISTDSGRAQIQLTYQGGGWSTSKPVVTQIVAKLFRDGNPDNHFAATTLDFASKTTSTAGGATSSSSQGTQPQVIVPEATDSSSSAGTTATPPSGSSTSTTSQGMMVQAQPLQLQQMPVGTMALATKLPVVASYTMGTSRSCASGAKGSFLTKDFSIYLRVVLNNSKAGDIYSYVWVDPRGTRYKTNTYNNLPTGSKVCHSNGIRIKGKAPATKPGTWSVKFYHNRQLKLTKRFRITK